MIAWFARNDVAANLLMISVLIGGAFALSYETAIEIFPLVRPRDNKSFGTPAGRDPGGC